MSLLYQWARYPTAAASNRTGTRNSLDLAEAAADGQCEAFDGAIPSACCCRLSLSSASFGLCLLAEQWSAAARCGTRGPAPIRAFDFCASSFENLSGIGILHLCMLAYGLRDHLDQVSEVTWYPSICWGLAVSRSAGIFGAGAGISDRESCFRGVSLGRRSLPNMATEHARIWAAGVCLLDASTSISLSRSFLIILVGNVPDDIAVVPEPYSALDGGTFARATLSALAEFPCPADIRAI